MPIRKKAVFIVAALAVFCIAAGAQTEHKATFKVRVTAEQANIRELPDIGSTMLLQLPEGTVLDAEAREDDWYRVRFTRRDGTTGTGWIHGSLVRPLDPEALPPRKPPVEKRPDIPLKPSPRTVESRSRIGVPAGKTGVALFGGAAYLAGGDLNSSARGLADYFGAAAGVRPSSKPNPLHLTYVLGFEISLPVAEGLFLGIGADYLSGRSSSEVFYKRGEATDILRTDPHLRALPLKAGLSFYSTHYFYARGALQLIFAKAGYGYRYEGEDDWREWTGEASALALGAEAALGGEWEFFPGAAVVAEAGYRRAKIGGFKGTDTLRESDGWTHTEDGRLYAYKAGLPGTDPTQYHMMFIRSKRPSEAGVYDVRDAAIDFSGPFLKIGFKIVF